MTITGGLKKLEKPVVEITRSSEKKLLIFRACLHFSLYCTVPSHLPTLIYFTCPYSSLILLCIPEKLRTAFPIYRLFRFLMSLYLALQEWRDVSFNLQQHLSCRLGHFSPICHIRFPICLVALLHSVYFYFYKIYYDTLNALVEGTGSN